MSALQSSPFRSSRTIAAIAMVVAVVAIASVLFVPAAAASPVTSSTAPHTYSVQLNERGLPTGTAWFVVITDATAAGRLLSSTTSSIVVALPNGTYSVRAGTDNLRWAPDPATVTIHVMGAPFATGFKFNPRAVFPVTFNEKGLPAGASWRVDVSGASIPATSATSTASSITIALPNGSFDFTVTTTANHYKANSASGSFHVSGAPLSRDIKFEKGSVPLAPLLASPGGLPTASSGMTPAWGARTA